MKILVPASKVTTTPFPWIKPRRETSGHVLGESSGGKPPPVMVSSLPTFVMEIMVLLRWNLPATRSVLQVDYLS